MPVTEERVRVERRVVDRPVSAADADAFEETVIEVPLRSETVDVQKQARVAEEVVVSKEAVQRTEQVTRHGAQGRGLRRRGRHRRRVVRRRSRHWGDPNDLDLGGLIGLNRIAAPWPLPS